MMSKHLSPIILLKKMMSLKGSMQKNVKIQLAIFCGLQIDLHANLPNFHILIRFQTHTAVKTVTLVAILLTREFHEINMLSEQAEYHR